MVLTVSSNFAMKCGNVDYWSDSLFNGNVWTIGLTV